MGRAWGSTRKALFLAARKPNFAQTRKPKHQQPRAKNCFFHRPEKPKAKETKTRCPKKTAKKQQVPQKAFGGGKATRTRLPNRGKTYSKKVPQKRRKKTENRKRKRKRKKKKKGNNKNGEKTTQKKRCQKKGIVERNTLRKALRNASLFLRRNAWSFCRLGARSASAGRSQRQCGEFQVEPTPRAGSGPHPL